MKYLVEVKFTNPSHEHISLRRRIETITRIVEAANEDQAILRVTSQQRSLGFFIKEAKIVKEKSHEKEGADETMIAKGKEVMKKADGKDKEDEEIEEGNGTASYPLLKPGQKLKPMKLKMGEEVEQIDELDEAKKQLKPSYWRAEWRLGTQSEVDKNNKKIFDRLAKTDPVKASAFHDNLMRMKKKDIKKEAVDPDKREAGYKMSPAVKAAQAKSDALSKSEKKHQAGTLGAHKARKAAEKMVDAVKAKVNKINMTPSMEPGKQ